MTSAEHSYRSVAEFRSAYFPRGRRDLEEARATLVQPSADLALTIRRAVSPERQPTPDRDPAGHRAPSSRSARSSD